MRKHNRKADKAQRTHAAAKAAKGRISGVKEKPLSVCQDYSIYQFSLRERIKYVFLYSALDACISYLFFFSWTAFLLLLPGAVLFFRERREALQKRRAVEMKRQFMDGMQLLTVSLQAGYSVENSVREAVKELRRVYEPEAFIVREFQIMEAQLTVNRNMEELFMDFGERSAVDDIQSFAEVFLTAKRSGGDLIAVIRNTVFCIRQKQETLHEIETSLAGKVMEQNVMSMIPLFILAYVKFTSPDFLGVMYGNLTGVTIMVLCFLVYVLAYFWGRNIVQIEV